MNTVSFKNWFQKRERSPLISDYVPRIHFLIMLSWYVPMGLMLLSSCAGSRNIRVGANNVEVFNRQLDMGFTDPYTIRVDSQQGAGLMTIRNLAFEYGVLELDLQGENKPGASFIGLAFNIENDSTYELIYFRPFNFAADNISSRSHSIQYICAPEYPWYKLRKEFPGKYEAEYSNPPDPNNWFTIRISITPTAVEVFDKKSRERLLNIDRLASTTSNKIGFWTGTNSSGSFRNLNLIKIQ